MVLLGQSPAAQQLEESRDGGLAACNLAMRLCGGSAPSAYRPPLPRRSHVSPGVVSASAGGGRSQLRWSEDRRRPARAFGPGIVGLVASPAALAWAWPARAERLYPPLGNTGSGGGGGGGGGSDTPAGSAAAAGGQKRVMILMSDTGGGHRASAEALKSAFHIKFGNKFNVSVVDLWSNHAPWPVNQLPKSYGFLVKHQWLWRFNFEFTSAKPVSALMFATYGTLVSRSFAAAFDKYVPDLVVSVHPLMQHIPIRVLQRRRARTRAKPPPFTTVVTDLTSCHPTWFHRGVAACFVPTPEVEVLALKAGLAKHQIIMHGLPIRPAFASRLPPLDKLRKQLGIDPKGPVILLMGGGEGMGLLEATCEALGKQLPAHAQVVVVCGRNKALAAKLSGRVSSYTCTVHVKGFLTNVDEWMGASDLVITKAGPGTIAEALIRGVPLMLNGAIPCQEEGNVPYVVDNGVGRFSTDPGAIAKQVADWCGAGAAELAEMAKRAKALGRPHATFDIVEDLAALTP